MRKEKGIQSVPSSQPVLGEDNVVPKLIGKSALDITQRPALFVPQVLELGFEKRDLVFVGGFFQVFLDGGSVFL